MIYESILDTIGRTPIVRLHRVAPPHVSLYAKVESFNPGGSVKDRLAIAVILDAEQKGLLKPGDTVIEATSGNTGVPFGLPHPTEQHDRTAIASRVCEALILACRPRCEIAPQTLRGR